MYKDDDFDLRQFSHKDLLWVARGACAFLKKIAEQGLKSQIEAMLLDTARSIKLDDGKVGDHHVNQ